MPTVRILNPAAGDGWTTVKQAQAYVASGAAVWRNKPDGSLAIKFAQFRAANSTLEWDGIDRSDAPATLEQMEGVPLMNVKLPVHQRPQLDARGHRRRA